MTTFQDAMTALRAADKAGNVEDARRLAAIAQGLRPDGEEFELSAVARFGRGQNIAIANILGAPVDLVNVALKAVGIEVEEPVGGSRMFQRAFSKVPLLTAEGGFAPPPGVGPEGTAGKAGEFTAIGAATLLGATGAGLSRVGAAVPITTGPASRLAKVPGQVAQTVAEQAVKAPAKTAAIEGVAASTAFTAGEFAAQTFPERPSARAFGEIGGGFAPVVVVRTLGAAVVGSSKATMALAEKSPLIGTSVGWLRRRMTLKGAQQRAEERVERAVQEPESARREVVEAEVLADARLTPPQRSGDAGLLALERAVMESTQQLRGARDAQITVANQAIHSSLRELGRGAIEDTRATMMAARAYLSDLLDARVRIAQQRAMERIAAIEPATTRERTNTIAREEIEGAYNAARDQETQLWGAVPEETQVSPLNVRDIFAAILAKRARSADPADVPNYLRKWIGTYKEVEGEVVFVPGKFADVETIHELQTLRSRVLSDIRAERANPTGNRRKIAILEDVQEGLLADMGATTGAVEGEAGAALRIALDFSFDLNNRFMRGPVGRLRGFEKRGAPAVAEGLTLEQTIGPGGPRAREATDALLNAVKRTGDEPAMRAAVEDFLKNEFQRVAVRGGQVNKAAAERFMGRHEETLTRLPVLKKEFTTAIESGEAALVLANRQTATLSRLNDPNIARSAVFLGAPPGKEMARVMASSDPPAVMAEVVRQASRDPTGKALRGLKSAFIEGLLTTTALPRADLQSTPVLSGHRMIQMLKTPKVNGVVRVLFTEPGELRRLAVTANTARRVEMAIETTADTEGIIRDAPNQLVELFARIFAAQVGRVIATKTGGGTVQTPGILSERVRAGLQALTVDPAARLIVDGIQDRRLFLALLSGRGAVPAARKEATRRLNAWGVGVIKDAGGEIDLFEQEGQAP